MNEHAAPVILSELTGDGVMLLTLNRPERHNAWTLEMELLYNEQFDRAEADPAVRAVVLTGAGRSFCPGMDMSVLDGASSGARPWPTDQLPPRTRPMSFPKPLVAAVNGACAGIGFNQALMCDVRFAVPGAKFAAAFSARGLVAEDGVSWLLPRLVGYGNASDLLLSSRRITGTEAEAMGLVNRLVEPEELLPAALTYATELARSASPYAMSLIKRQLADDQARSFTESRDTAAALLATAKRAPDYREGVRSFIERRQPDFAGLGDNAPETGGGLVVSRAELPLHRRTITVTAHQEPGGEEISVEAELRDERPWAEPAAADIHRMVLAVRVRLADMTIVAADADMLTFPHAECPFITPVFDSLVGLGVAAGYNRAIQERFRGVLGCSHLHELARVLGPAVVQAAMSANARRRDAGEVANGPRATAGVLNSCHIWAPDGVGLRKLDAGWRPGTGPRPVPELDTFERPTGL